MLIPCSRSAHDQNVLARRPQWDQHGCHSTREEQASLEGACVSSDARREGYPGYFLYLGEKQKGLDLRGCSKRPSSKAAVVFHTLSKG
jgi:hypothetical protein